MNKHDDERLGLLLLLQNAAAAAVAWRRCRLCCCAAWNLAVLNDVKQDTRPTKQRDERQSKATTRMILSQSF